MVKRMLLSLMLIALTVSASGCSEKPSGTESSENLDIVSSVESEIPENDPVTETAPVTEYSDLPVYNVPVRNVFESGFNISRVALEYEPWALLDNHRIITTGDQYVDMLNPPTDYRVYDFVKKQMSAPIFPADNPVYSRLVYADSRYALFETTEDGMIISIEGTLVLCDLITLETTTIYKYPLGEYSEVGYWNATGTHPNSKFVFDGKVYFDDYNDWGENSTVFSYDIASGTLETVREHAMNPIAVGGEVVFFVPNENGEYKTLVNEAGEVRYENEHEINAIAGAGGRVFTERITGEDSNLGTTLVGIYELGQDAPIVESRRGNVLWLGSNASPRFMSWTTSMGHGAACFYSPQDNTIYEFTGINAEYPAFDICENAMLVWLSGEYYLLT